MQTLTLLATTCCMVAPLGAAAQAQSADTIPTSTGDLVITFVGHGTLLFQHAGRVIHVDPVRREADYAAMPAADVIVITHAHGDHCDSTAVATIATAATEILLNQACATRIGRGTVVANGEVRSAAGLTIEALPAYNLVHMRSEDTPYHPRADGNGYVISFGDTRVYVAGDTENTPEMKALEDIDVAFLPMNLPYTMTPEMVADAARAFRPRILYPYHYGDTDVGELVRLLEEEDGIEVRVREM